MSRAAIPGLRLLAAIAASLAAASCASPAAGPDAVTQPAPLAPAPFFDAVPSGAISNAVVCEASGLAPSRRRADVLWVLNDSGNTPELFAVTTCGVAVATVRLAGVENEDWEDLASFRLDGKPHLLVADCGDNPGFRETCVLHVVPEPAVGAAPVAPVPPAWSIRYRYEDGPRDCESVAVDAGRGRVLLLSKDARTPVLYELELAPADRTAMQVARKVGPMRGIPPPAGGLSRGILARIGSLTTAMDLAPDGRRLAVLTYEDAYLFERKGDEGWAAPVARPPVRIALPDPANAPPRKREALCWDDAGRDLFVTGEQVPAPLLRVPAAPPGTLWRVETLPDAWKLTGFAGGHDVSGIAAGGGRGVLVVSDELRSAQAGEIDREARTIVAGAEAPLLPAGSRTEADLEAVAAAADGRAYYATGSHGVGKKKAEQQDTRCLAFRIPADPATGRPAGPVETSGLLPWVERDPVLGPYAGQALSRNGFNLEGLAWRDGRLWFGVRAPNLGGDTFVIETEADALFRTPLPEATLHRIGVGAGLGIRELAAVRDGFLLLLGEAYDGASAAAGGAEHPGFAFAWWTPGRAPARIGSLPAAPGKAEGLLVLREDDRAIDVLVLFDGEAQGGARAYRLHRP